MHHLISPNMVHDLPLPAAKYKMTTKRRSVNIYFCIVRHRLVPIHNVFSARFNYCFNCSSVEVMSATDGKTRTTVNSKFSQNAMDVKSQDLTKSSKRMVGQTKSCIPLRLEMENVLLNPFHLSYKKTLFNRKWYSLTLGMVRPSCVKSHGIGSFNINGNLFSSGDTNQRY